MTTEETPEKLAAEERPGALSGGSSGEVGANLSGVEEEEEEGPVRTVP